MITDIRYFGCPINDESMNQLANSINEGFSILKLDLSNLNETDRYGNISNTPYFIAILIKTDESVTDGQ